jgi:hypothetical protein
VAVLRLGLADELDRLSGDLVAVNRPLESVRSTGDKPDEALVQARDRLVNAARRVSAIKRQYGNTPAEDDLLRRFLRDKLTGPAQATSQPAGAAADTKPKGDAAPSASPGDGKARDSPGKNTPSQP